MRTEEFRIWLIGKGHPKRYIQNIITNCNGIELHCKIDLDVEFRNDKGNRIMALLTYSKEDEKNNRSWDNIQINGNLYNGIATYKRSANKYKEFCASTASIEEIENDVNAINNNKELSVEEKRILVKYRLGQSKYRKSLIEHWGGCSVSGCSNPELLIASHIKPYGECEDNEKYHLCNGLLLTPNYDKLFDNYLITFDAQGKIIISDLISEDDLGKLNISRKDTLRLDKLKPEDLTHLITYLNWHRDKFNEEDLLKK